MTDDTCTIDSGRTESELQEQLKRVEYDTLDGNQCRAEITAIEETGGEIQVTVELPSGRTHSEQYPIPEVASEEYEFVRLLNTTGYGLSALDNAVGSDVRVEITDDGPEFVVPEPDRPLSEKFGEKIPPEVSESVLFVTVIATFPICGKSALIHMDSFFERDPFMLYLMWISTSIFWAVTIGQALLSMVGVVL